VKFELGSLKDFLKEYLNPFKQWRLQFLGWSILISIITIFILFGGTPPWGLQQIAAHSTDVLKFYAAIYLVISYLAWFRIRKDVLNEDAQRDSIGWIVYAVLGLIPLLIFLFAVMVYWLIFPIVR